MSSYKVKSKPRTSHVEWHKWTFPDRQTLKHIAVSAPAALSSSATCRTCPLGRLHSVPAASLTRHSTFLIWPTFQGILVQFCCCNKTLWPKQTWGEKGVFGLPFQVTIHHQGKSGPELRTGAMKPALHASLFSGSLWLTQSHSLLVFLYFPEPLHELVRTWGLLMWRRTYCNLIEWPLRASLQELQPCHTLPDLSRTKSTWL